MLTDESKMAFGRYEGYLLKNVPAWYLLKLFKDMDSSRPLYVYIEANLERLKKEKREADKAYFSKRNALKKQGDEYKYK